VWLDAARAAVVRLSLRLSPSEAQRVFALTLVLGGLCGLVAVAFHLAIHAAQRLLFERFGPDDGWAWVPWVVLVPGLGGLAAGFLLQRVVPSARGSGIPQVKTAYALDTSGARLRDAVGKFAVCVLQLGSGASLGREGPTVQICAGVATSVGRWLALSPANLRRLIPVGAAAGVAAAFNAPIAAVTFTIEEVVGTLDGTVLSGVVVAAALAAVVEHSVLGGNPVLGAPLGAGLHHASSLPLYALLGVSAAFVSIAFTDLLLGTRERFRRMRPVPEWVRPGIGGLVTGALAAIGIAIVGEQGVAGGGYETLARALTGQLALHALALLCVLKLLSTVSSYSSGGAGGIFAPTLFVGAMLGGIVGNVDVWVFGHDRQSELSSFALVGMGAVFAGVVRAPMTSVLIVFEMTGGYELVLPLMIANTASYVIARRYRPTPIYEALLAQDGVHLPHGTGSRGPLLGLEVRGAMTTDLVTVDAATPVSEAAHAARRHGHATYPVLDAQGSFVGLLSEARMQRTIAEGGAARTAGDVARRKEYTVPDEPLLRAVARMQRLGVRQLPVLQRGTATLVGMLAMSDVLRAQVRAAESAGLATASMAERATLEPLTLAAARGDPTGSASIDRGPGRGEPPPTP
jgi:CIC family chloride channel protein